MVTGYESKYYSDISRIERHLERIAKALEKMADLSWPVPQGQDIEPVVISPVNDIKRLVAYLNGEG